MTSKGVKEDVKYGMKLNNYVLEKKIGKGNFSEVWLGRDIRDQKLYAIKKILKEKLKTNAKLNALLKTEVSIMNTIKNRNVMKLFDFLETSSSYYLVLEYMKDGDLESILRKTKLNRVDENTAVFYLKQIASGFQELRKYKIFHRDIKLANLFIDDGRLVIGDFGFAKSGVEQTSTVLGTPLTMAPELLLNSKDSVKYGPKADIWSIGVVFYQLLFGQLPFPGSTVNEIRKNIIRFWGKNLPISLPISAESRELLVRMLDIEPESRLDWPEFFNHAVFKKFASTIESKEKLCPCCQSNRKSTCTVSQNRFSADQDFFRNAQLARKETNFEFKDHDELVAEFRLDAKLLSESSLSPEERFALSSREISECYAHEMKKAGFIVFTSSLLLRALKRPAFVPFYEILAIGASLCAKKAMAMNQKMLDSLRDMKNYFRIDETHFTWFCSSPSHKETIKKCEEEVSDSFKWLTDCQLSTSSVPKSKTVISALQSPNPKLSDLDILLDSVLTHLSKPSSPLPFQKSPEDLKTFLQAVFCLRCAIGCQRIFTFQIPTKPATRFSWPAFSASFDSLSLEDFLAFFSLKEINQDLIANLAN